MLDAALPWLYLKGFSTGQMAEALSVLVGPDAKELSAQIVSRLKGQWREAYEVWRRSEVEQESLGILVGRRNLQRASRGRGAVLFSRDRGGE
jgi:hypothetical protein